MARSSRLTPLRRSSRSGSPRGRPQGLEEPEVHALLRVAGESRYGHARRNYAVVQFLLQTGLRISEAAALCLADLKLRERTGSVRVRQGKGRKEREVPLNASARRALRTYLEPRGALPPDAPLFLSGRGGPIAVRSIQNLIAQLARRAKITRVRVSPHNTVRMGEIVARLRAAGETVSDEDLARISPLAYAHVIPNGTYVFDHSRRGNIALIRYRRF